jgi:hypothetical protein
MIFSSDFCDVCPLLRRRQRQATSAHAVGKTQNTLILILVPAAGGSIEEFFGAQWSQLAEVIFRHSGISLQDVGDRLRLVRSNVFNIDSNRQFSDISGAGTFAACLRR